MASDSENVKRVLMVRIQTENQVANARQLIETVQTTCFDKCIPKPGDSMSRSESTCVSSCIEKYMAAWNQVNATYMSRLRQASEKNL